MRLPYWAYYHLARFHLMLRQHEKAAGAYRLALAANPRFALAAASLGFLHASRGCYAEAAAAFQKALHIKQVSEFDPKVTQQLIRETGQLPEGVARR